jgi:chemotaxis protein histidine kinase CheA
MTTATSPATATSQILMGWALNSLASAAKEVQRLGIRPQDRVCLNELALSLHTARCYAAMAGFRIAQIEIEILEDEVCRARTVRAPLTGVWIGLLSSRIDALRCALSSERCVDAANAPHVGSMSAVNTGGLP